MAAYIRGISYYLPQNALANEALAVQFPEWSVEKIGKKIGIDQRHVAASDEFTSDMAVHAAEALFQEYDIDRGDVDFVILCTQSPDYFLPTTACLVQHRLGIPTTVGAFDFNLGCSGYVYGLALAKGLIEGGMARNVLLLTSETYSKFIDESDKGNRAIFGDAASATWVAPTGTAAVHDFVFGTDGAGAENLIVRNGATRHPARDGSRTEKDGQSMSNDHLYMNGGEIFSFTLESVPVLVKSTLEKNVLREDEIDHYVFHQANKYMLDHLRKKIKIPEDRFPVHMASCGNTVSATLAIALKEMMRAGQVQAGHKALLAGFGVGYSWAGTVITFGKDGL